MKTEKYKTGDTIPAHVLRATYPERQTAATFGCDVTVSVEKEGVTVHGPVSDAPLAVIVGDAIEGECWSGAPTSWLRDAATSDSIERKNAF